MLLFSIFLLFFLFLVLGLAADVVVKNIKHVAGVLGMPLFTFGLLLGLITTLPELSVGINATINNIAAISVGNTLGGIIVILGLISGVNLIFSKDIHTDGRLTTVLPVALMIFLAIGLSWDGHYSLIDGLLMILSYFLLVFYLQRKQKHFSLPAVLVVNRNRIGLELFMALLGISVVIMTSHYIVEVFEILLEKVAVSKLFIGALIFSVGTNLPEISITLSSWRKKSSELSLSHLFSSAFSNILVLGILASVKPISFSYGLDYKIMAGFLVVMVIAFSVFYYSGKKMEKREGWVLLGIYLLFLLANFYLLRFLS